jgi:hypothetical protein
LVSGLSPHSFQAQGPPEAERPTRHLLRRCQTCRAVPAWDAAPDEWTLQRAPDRQCREDVDGRCVWPACIRRWCPTGLREVLRGGKITHNSYVVLFFAHHYTATITI